jgi:ABC-type multidrug transport system fused ATPase/permease subunit
MANNLIPEELNALIQQYLTDGVLTDKERQVILNKAEKMGLDRDEIDLYLDAQVQKIDQATDAAVRRQKGKACPHCGAYVSQMADKCPECGQYITPEATKELEEILDNLEEALVNMKSQKDFERNKAIVERYERKARMYYSNHPKIKVLLSEVDAEMDIAEKRVKSLQRSESVKSFFTNPWTYGALFIILTILVIVFFIYMTNKTAHEEGEDSAMWWGMGIFYIGVPCIIGTVSFINKVCLKKH